MKQLQSIRILLPIATALALFYVALAITASVCLFDHPASQANGHHHSGQQSNKAAHSALCAWACQAKPDTTLASAAPFVQPFLLVCVAALASMAIPSSSPIVRLRSRGPPQSV